MDGFLLDYDGFDPGAEGLREALTSTRSADSTGVRVQVPRRQPGGSWLRIMDRPGVPQP